MGSRDTARGPFRIQRPNRLAARSEPADPIPHAACSVLPVVDEFFKTMAPYEPPERARMFADIRKAIQDKSLQRSGRTDESINFLLRDTIAVTMLGGSQQTNVIPPEAWANVDVRLLPGADPKEFLESIRRVVNDPNVTVEPAEPGVPRRQLLSHRYGAV